MNNRFQRLTIIILSVLFLSIAIILILINSKNYMVFFYTPSELLQSSIKINDRVRIGGFVKKESIVIKSDGKIYNFIITDKKNDIFIEYEGILPDLFSEEKGAVVEGILVNKKKILAKKVFAKHDENYMPLSIKKELEAKKYWKKDY